MLEKQILARTVGIKKKAAGNHAFFRDSAISDKCVFTINFLFGFQQSCLSRIFIKRP